MSHHSIITCFWQSRLETSNYSKAPRTRLILSFEWPLCPSVCFSVLLHWVSLIWVGNRVIQNLTCSWSLFTPPLTMVYLNGKIPCPHFPALLLGPWPLTKSEKTGMVRIRSTVQMKPDSRNRPCHVCNVDTDETGSEYGQKCENHRQ